MYPILPVSTQPRLVSLQLRVAVVACLCSWVVGGAHAGGGGGPVSKGGRGVCLPLVQSLA